MASGRLRSLLGALGLAGLGLALGPAAFILGHRSLQGNSLPVGRRALTTLRARKPPPELAKEARFLANYDIKYTEVRLVGEWSTTNKREEEMNEVLLTSDALRRAEDLGLDLVLINEAQDPPTVKIVNLGKFTYQQEKFEKARARQGKMPKIKEIKISYTVGDHDLNTKLKQAKKWLENHRQQVKVTVQMKGRTRMFERQARSLLKRILLQVAEFGKAAGTPKSPDEAIVKDNAQNLFITLRSGEDTKLLKMLKEQAEDEEEEDEEEEADAEPASDAAPRRKKKEEPMSEELKELQEELEEVRQDLLDCGIKPGQLNQQPEFADVMQRIREAKERVSMGAAVGRSLNHAPVASLPLAAGCLVAALTLRPRSQARGRFVR